MKTFKALIIVSLFSLSSHVFSFAQVQPSSSVFTGGGGTVSPTFPTSPTTNTATSTAVRDTSTIIISNSDSNATGSTYSPTASSTPQFGVRDLKVSTDGQCKIGSTTRAWIGSPCARVYGVTAPVSASSASGTSTAVQTGISSVYGTAIRNTTFQEATFSGSAPSSAVLNQAPETISTSPAPTSTYYSAREAFY